jgi:hypothetical protein
VAILSYVRPLPGACARPAPRTSLRAQLSTTTRRASDLAAFALRTHSSLQHGPAFLKAALHHAHRIPGAPGLPIGNKERRRMLAGFRSMSSVNHLNSWRLNDGLVPVEYEDGQKDFFTGSDGELVRSEYLNGNKQYYEGKKGEEHIVRVEFPGGEKSFFEGKKGEEHLVRIESSDGNKQYY